MTPRESSLRQLYSTAHDEVENKTRILRCHRDAEDCGALALTVACWDVPLRLIISLSVRSGPLPHCVAHVLFWNIS